jgi:hypothetical protein
MWIADGWQDYELLDCSGGGCCGTVGQEKTVENKVCSGTG